MTIGAGIHVRPLGAADAAPYRALRLDSLRNFQFAHRPAYEDALAQSEAWHADRLARPDYAWFGAFGFEPFGLEPDAIYHEGGYRAIHHLHLSLVSSDSHEQPIS